MREGLLTARGMGPREARYRFGDKEHAAQLSPVALYHLLPEDERFEAVVAVCTKDALKDTIPGLKCGMLVPCRPVTIPDGSTRADLQAMVLSMLREIPMGSRLMLDLTHGPRHFPFLFFASCPCLTALGDAETDHVWYGRLEEGKGVGGGS